EEAVRRRDGVAEHRDDSRTAAQSVREGAELIRGTGRISGPGNIRVRDKTYAYEDLVIATGSKPLIPDIPGSDQIDVWTTEDVFSSAELPPSMIVIGGSAAGCEIAQIYASY